MVKKLCKYCTGYNDNHNIISLRMKLLQMIEYAKYFDSIKIMSFKIDDKKYLQSTLKYQKILEHKNKIIWGLSKHKHSG